jgi:putative ABC transport system ATP-binding protein
LLKQVAKEWGRAVLMVTHDPHIAAYSDRIVFLKDGKVVNETILGSKNVGNQEIVTNQMKAMA